MNTNKILENGIRCISLIKAFKIFKDNFKCDIVRVSDENKYKITLKDYATITKGITFNFTIILSKNCNFITVKTVIGNVSVYGSIDIDAITAIDSKIANDIVVEYNYIIPYIKSLFSIRTRFEINHNFKIIFKPLYDKAKSLYNRAFIYYDFIVENGDSIRFKSYLDSINIILKNTNNIINKAHNYFSGIVEMPKYLCEEDMRFYDDSIKHIDMMINEINTLQEKYEDAIL